MFTPFMFFPGGSDEALTESSAPGDASSSSSSADPGLDPWLAQGVLRDPGGGEDGSDTSAAAGAGAGAGAAYPDLRSESSDDGDTGFPRATPDGEPEMGRGGSWGEGREGTSGVRDEERIDDSRWDDFGDGMGEEVWGEGEGEGW